MNLKKMGLSCHDIVGKTYKSNDEALETVKMIDENPPKVDFRLLWELHQEFPSYTVGELIGYLEMNDVSMTDAVRKLGICAGILYG